MASSSFSSYDLFVILPETKEIIPFQLTDPEADFQVIIDDLQSQGKPTNLVFYSGLQSLPIQPSHQVKDYLTSHQSQISFWAMSSVTLFPTAEINPGYFFLQIIGPDFRPYLLQALSSDTIEKIIQSLYDNYHLRISIIRLDSRNRVELRDNEIIGEVLPVRNGQILFLSKDNRALIEKYSFLNMLSNEDALKIIKYLAVPEIIGLCRSSSNLAKFCWDESLWKFLTKSDLGLTNKPEDKTWKENYYQKAHYRADKLLIEGAETGNMNLVQTGLYFGAKMYNKAIRAAVGGGYLEIVKMMLDQGANLYIPDIIEIAAFYGHKEILQMLQVREPHWHNSAMVSAARGGHIEIVKTMLDLGATNYNEAMTWAAYTKGGHREIVEMMLVLMNNDTTKPRSYDQALVYAAGGGHREIVQMILNYGGEGLRIYDYKRAMFLAAKEGHLGIMEMMLKKGANTSAVNEYNEAMLEAAKNGHQDVVERLLTLGANNYGWAMIEAAGGGHRKIVQIMINLGGENITIYYYNMAMIRAGEGGHMEIVQWMLSRGANDYNSTMIRAAYGDHKKIIERMLSLMTINKIKPDYNNTMWVAAGRGHKNIVQMMLNHGANNYDDAMRAAAQDGHHEIVEKMLDLGANNYNSAMRDAALGDHRGIVQMMLDLGADDYSLTKSNAFTINHIETANLIADYEKKNSANRRKGVSTLYNLPKPYNIAHLND